MNTSPTPTVTDRSPMDLARLIFTLVTVAGMLVLGAYAAVAETPDAKSKFEQDRAAILAMAGEYHIDFQFQETVGIQPGYELRDPYHSEATEFVEVVEDTGDRIVLQHVLVLHGEDDAEPRVIKHWRQDWVYEDTRVSLFRGNRQWEALTLEPAEVAGTWSQAVYQVDDSPRYEGWGAWTHTGDRSAWESNETWRPLPRREYTKRDDYQVMVARNRHTITPSGWVHEQDNRKLVLNEDGAVQTVLAHESGLNVYDRVDDVDFGAGRRYWSETRVYWQDVREMWHDALDRPGVTRVAAKLDDKPVYAELFGIANDVRDAGRYEPTHREAASAVIRSSVTNLSGATSRAGY